MNFQEVYIKPNMNDATWVTRDVDSDYPFFANDFCCDCDQRAVVLTPAKAEVTRQTDVPIWWGQCHGCADDTRQSTADARRQAEYDCER